MEKYNIIFLIIAIVLSSLALLSIIDTLSHKNDFTEGKCYDRYSHEIIGQSCEIPYQSPYTKIFAISSVVVLLTMFGYVLYTFSKLWRVS